MCRLQSLQFFLAPEQNVLFQRTLIQLSLNFATPWQRRGQPEHTLSRGMGTKECGYRLPHLLLPHPQVGGSIHPWQSARVCLPSLGLLWSPCSSNCFPLTPPTLHTPGLDFKPHLRAGLEELLEKTSPQIIQPGFSRAVLPSRHCWGRAKSTCQGVRLVTTPLPSTLHTSLLFIKNRLLFRIVLAKLSGRCRDFPHMPSLSHYQQFPPVWDIVTGAEPRLTCHCHLESIVYMRIHCCGDTFYGFGQMCDDMYPSL